MEKVSLSSLIGKSWKEITLVFLEFQGLLKNSSHQCSDEHFKLVQNQLRDAAAKLGGVFLEVLGTEIVMAFGTDRALYHTKGALSVLMDLKTSLNTKSFLSFTGALDVGEVVFSKRGEEAVAILGPLLDRVRTLGKGLPPNSIAVGPRVRELAHRQFHFTEGEKSPQIFLLQGFHSETSQIGEDASFSHQKIREEILDSLESFLRGDRKIFALQGEPGIGKTYFIKEIHRIFTSSHLCSLRIKGLSCPGSYGILREVFRKMLILGSDSLAKGLQDLCPEMNSFQREAILSFLREGNSPPPSELSGVMGRFAQNHRLALLLDDFDRSTDEEQQAFREILESGSFPLFLIFTLSSTSPFNLESMRSLSLLPLGEEDMVRLLETRVLEQGLSAKFLKTLVRYSQGNPTLGLAFLEEGRKKGSSLPPLSNRAREILVQKIELLNREEQWIVKVASVIGDKMPLSLLARVLEKEEGLLEEPLESLQNRGIFFRKDKKIYFSTPYLHRVTEESLLQSQKRNLHKKIGEVLKRDSFGTGPLFQVEHLLKGEQRKDGLELALTEASKLKSRGESYEGLWLLEQVESLLGTLEKGELEKVEERKRELMDF